MVARDDMAAYMRDRRARLKAGAKAAVRAGDARMPEGPEARRARLNAEREAMKAAGGRPVFTYYTPTGELGFGDGNKPKPPRKPPLPAIYSPPPPPVHVVAPGASAAPRSMLAAGGKPGRGLVPQGEGYALPPDQAAASQFTRFQTNSAAMLAALAARADAQDRRIAALEAQAANRKADALAAAQAFFGIVRHAFAGGR